MKMREIVADDHAAHLMGDEHGKIRRMFVSEMEGVCKMMEIQDGGIHEEI